MDLVIRTKLAIDFGGNDVGARTVSVERTDENEVNLKTEVQGDSEAALYLYFTAIDAASLGTQLIAAAAAALPE